MIRRLLKKTLRMRKNEDGATAIEFGMLAAPFLLLLIGVFEAGSLLLVNYQLDDAVADMARQIRTGQAQAIGMSAAAFKKAVCDKVVIMRDCNGSLLIDVDTFPDFSSFNFPPPLEEKTNPDGTVSKSLSKAVGKKFNIGTAKSIVGIRVYYPYKFVTRFFPKMTGLTDYDNVKLLSTAAAFRNEPYK